MIDHGDSESELSYCTIVGDDICNTGNEVKGSIIAMLYHLVKELDVSIEDIVRAIHDLTIDELLRTHYEHTRFAPYDDYIYYGYRMSASNLSPATQNAIKLHSVYLYITVPIREEFPYVNDMTEEELDNDNMVQDRYAQLLNRIEY
jgi:hypothetical protein